jgi:hypothetical protein
MYFKPNPKAQVELKFRELFGQGSKVKVLGERMRSQSGLAAHYVSTLTVDGRTVATASHADWRKSYGLLKLEVERLHADGVVIA